MFIVSKRSYAVRLSDGSFYRIPKDLEAVQKAEELLKVNDIRPDAGEEAGRSLEEQPETDEAPKAGNARRGRK